MKRNRSFPSLLALAFAALAAALPASAVPPVVPAANPIVTLDGVPLGSAIAFRSGYPTILYDAATRT